MPNNAAVAESPSPWGRLIEAVATRRDRAAFVRLFQHFAPRVKTFMLRSGASEAAAEEIAQETMLTVWRKADSFKPEHRGCGRLDIHDRPQSPDRRAPARAARRRCRGRERQRWRRASG